MTHGVTILPLAQYPASSATAGAPARLRGFVVDDGNWLALAAVEALLSEQSPEQVPAIILLHGNSGVGKTHLARALAVAWRQSRPNSRVLFATAADFARQFLPTNDDDPDSDPDALSETIDQPNSKIGWETVDLFVLDHLDDLADKPAAQQHLAAILDRLESHGGCAIVTARQNPARAQRLAPRLRGRLAAALSVPLRRLDAAGRLAVLRELAIAQGIVLGQSLLADLASAIEGPVSELSGALATMTMNARATGRAVDDALVFEYLAARPCATIGMDTITAQVAAHFRVKASELRGAGRRKELVAARSVAIHLARTLRRDSLQAIGRYFGGRDHATILYNLEKVARELAAGEPQTCQAVAQLRDTLDAATPTDSAEPSWKKRRKTVDERPPNTRKNRPP